MRKLVAAITAAFVMVLAVPAGAAIDLGNGVCFDEGTGENGLFNGTSADDAGCVTKAEYAQMFTPENLVATGVFDAVIFNDDGTSTGVLADSGVSVTVESDPLARPVAANTNPESPAYEPNAPTVEQWFDGRLSGAVSPI